jgi:putative PEP-CTERM system TPR-repeat lipoprotein
MQVKIKKLFKVTLIAAAVTLSGCGSDTIEDHLSSAAKHTQANDYKSTIIALKKALLLEPSNEVARVKLAEAFVKDNKFRDAESVLNKVIEGKDASPLAIALMSKIKFELKKHTETFMLSYSDFKEDKDSELQSAFYAAMSAVQEGNQSKVAEFIKKAGSIDKESPYTLVAQAWAALASQNIEDAQDLASQALEKEPEFGPAIFITARLFDVNGQVSEAKEAYEKYVKLFPNDLDKQIYLYQALMSLGDLDAADVVVDDIYKKHPKHPLVNLYKAQISYEKGDFQAASDFAKNVLMVMDKHLSAKLIAGASAYKLGDYKQAYSFLTPFDGKLKNGSVNRMLLMTKLKLGYAGAVADEIIANADKDSLDLDILLVTSMDLSRTGSQDKAIELLELAGGATSKDAKIVAQQGLTRLSMNDITGVELLEKSIELDDELEGAKLALAMAHIRMGNIAKAVNIAKSWQENPETKILGNLLNAAIYTQQEKHVQAKEIYSDILKEDPQNIAALYSTAQYLEKEGDAEGSLAAYKQVISFYPGHVDALSKLTEINQSKGKVSDTIVFLTKISKLNVDNVKLKLNLAYNYFLNKESKKSIEILKTVEANGQTPDAYWIVLGDSYMQSGLLASGIQSFKSLVAANPSNRLGHLRYMTALEHAKRFTAALHAARNAKVSFKEDPLILLLEVRYELQNNDASKVLGLIDTIKDLGFETQEIIAYEAEANFRLKKYSESAQLYITANNAQYKEEYILGAAKSYVLNGDNAAASDLLELNLMKSENEDQMNSLIAEVNFDINLEKSLRYFSKVLPKRPDDLFLLNNIAMVQLKLDLFEEALVNSEKSYRLNSSHPSILNTYGSALVANKNYKEAIEILEKAIKLGSENVDAIIYLAKAYDKSAKYGDHISILQKGLKLNPTEEQKSIMMSMLSRV